MAVSTYRQDVGPASFALAQQERRNQQFQNLLNIYLTKQQMKRQMGQQDWERQMAEKQFGLSQEKLGIEKQRAEAYISETQKPQPISKWQYNIGLINSLDLSPNAKKMVALGAPITNFIKGKTSVFSEDTINKISDYTGISTQEVKGYPVKKQAKLFDAMIGRLDKADETYKELQGNYLSQLKTAVTDFDQLINKLESPTKSLSASDMMSMSILGKLNIGGAEALFKNPEDREQDAARASVLKKIRNQLQTDANLAAEFKLPNSRWEKDKSIMGNLYKDTPERRTLADGTVWEQRKDGKWVKIK